MAAALLVCFGWIVALCLHEFCHAFVAYLGGDKSVKDKGYLTFNLLKYTDPGLTLIVPIVMLMLGGIALPGAAVYINRQNLRSRFWASLVSLAGPLGSAVMIFVYAAPFMLGMHAQEPDSWIWPSLALLVLLQVVAFILNSLPIPPLDGYGVFEPWLPRSLRAAVNNLGGAGIWIVFGLLWFVQPLNEALWTTALVVTSLLDVPPYMVREGYELFSKQKYYLVLIIVGILFLTKRKSKS